MNCKHVYFPVLCCLLFAACNNTKTIQSKQADKAAAPDFSGAEKLPAPYATPAVRNNSKVIGWPAGKIPIAPDGFTVTRFAEGLDNPRWIYVAPNGDIFIAMANTVSDGFTKSTGDVKQAKSSNTILIFRDKDGDGVPELKNVFLTGLNRPLGMLILNNKFYVANTDGLWTYPYETGQTAITGTGTKILDLPAGGYNNHWTRNIIASRDGSKNLCKCGIGHQCCRAWY